MKKNIFLDILLVLLIIVSVTEAFYLPGLNAKLFLSLVSCSSLISLLKGKVSNRILNPIVLIAGVFLYGSYLFISHKN